ncbi:MAG: hypothetical protein ACP5U0_08405 [Caldisphaera sp.]
MFGSAVNSEEQRSLVFIFQPAQSEKERKASGWFKPKPPGYMKEDRKRKLLLIIRNDYYAVG